MLLSLIIPFYNVEPYFEACLKGLETLPEETEILLIDDCGKDGSLKIAQRFCECTKNARVISRVKNGGLSAARNTGLAQAVGEYVFFLDSDDIPDGMAIYKAAEEARRTGAEIIKGRFSYLFEDGTRLNSPAVPAGKEMRGRDLFLAECRQNTFQPMVWQCVYKRLFLQEQHLSMQEGLLFEDEVFLTPALFRAGKVLYTDRFLLSYRQRKGSIMGGMQKSAAWCKSYMEICRFLNRFAEGETEDAAVQALRVRIGKIALSIGKNIPAYQLSGEVRAEAEAFLYRNRREISRYALKSPSYPVKLQGSLLRFSPGLFLRMYSLLWLRGHKEEIWGK